MISLIKYKNMTLDESINYLIEKEKNKVNKIEQIYTIFKNNKNNYSNINNFYKFSVTLHKICNYFNLYYNKIKYKIDKNNMTIEEAIMTPLTKINLNNFHYRGENDSMKNLCKKFNKNFIEVYNKVKYNHTFEWSMNSTKTKYDSKN